jgi:hypothetical protein
LPTLVPNRSPRVDSIPPRINTKRILSQAVTERKKKN